MKHKLFGESRYYVPLLEAYNGYVLIRFVARKSEAGNTVIQMVCKLRNLSNADQQRLMASELQP